MRYSIGLDIGATSVGYAVLALDSSDLPYRIEKLGSRIFDRAANSDGSSLALPRREARGARRRLRRHRHRLERIRGLIVSSGILSKEQLESLYDGQLSDIYELRAKALDEVVSREDFARIMIHLAQRRGYKSNRKSPEAEGAENGKILKAVAANNEKCIQNGYRTVGEMFFKDKDFAEYKRNKANDYSNTVDRKAIEDEARLIFSAQRSFGIDYANEENEERYLNILLSQRSFAEGPACGPYSGNQVDLMRGNCTFVEGEKRAPKASYTFQLFNLCQRINHIRLNYNGEVRSLTDEERQTVFDLAHKKAELNYAHIRRALDLPEDCDFSGVKYDEGKRYEKEKKTKIKDLEIYHKIKKTISKVSKDYSENITPEQLDAIGEAMCKNQSDEDITKELLNAEIPEDVIAELLKLPNFPKFGHLSVKACRKIIPHLMLGMTYDKACEAAGDNFKAKKTSRKMTLPPISPKDTEITNPVVRRAISQSIKVLNAIIREMDESPVYINIELARELAYDQNERNRITKEQESNAAKNEDAMNELREFVTAPKGHDLVKYKLWKEQCERCMYSGEPIERERLNEPGYVDVDHIVPYSICFDDRMVNKVLVLARENRQKSNRLPLQYLQGKKRDDFIILVSQSHLKAAKKSRLLKESITNETEWKQRNLQDTQYISSYMYRYISDNLLFAESNVDRKRKVTAVNGAITSYVRKRWGIKKIREDGDLHHAVDAVVIGCITQGMINRISHYSYYMETKDNGEYVVDKSTGELMTRFPTPWPHFSDELSIRMTQDEEKLRKMLNDVNYDSYLEVDLDKVKPPFVSRRSDHKVTGAAHEKTIRSGRMKEQEKTVSKVSLTELKLIGGEIPDYYYPESDLLLYNALKARLAEYGGNGKLAFGKEPFYKPKSDGSLGPVVKKVKVFATATDMVDVLEEKGVAKNENMVRCDVFYIEGDGYYFVPVYVSDTVSKELPDMAPVAGKDKNTGKKKRKKMRDEDFVFSLYPNDLIRVYSDKKIKLKKENKKSTLPDSMIFDGTKGVFLYYKGLDVSTAVINGITHDNTYKHRSIGKTTRLIEKYEVDVLGNTRLVKKETRRDFSNKKNDRRGKV